VLISHLFDPLSVLVHAEKTIAERRWCVPHCRPSFRQCESLQKDCGLLLAWDMLSRMHCSATPNPLSEEEGTQPMRT
jgi:hypothetical protein